MKLILKIYFLTILLFLSAQLASAQTIINGYAKVSSIAGNVFTISTTAGHQSEVAVTGTFNVGEKIIIMQMQDDVIGANTANNVNFGDLGTIQSAGLYEVATITAVSRGANLNSVTISGSTLNTYNTTTNSSLQIITYPKLGSPDFTTTSDMTCLAWNGNIGGILVFFVDGVFTLQHRLNVNERGFRGGVVSTNFFVAVDCTGNTRYLSNSVNDAAKGEGIYKNTNTNFERSRGKILSGGGGGNVVNAGGGGGGNFSSGGAGGAGWNSTPTGCSPSVGGVEGIGLSSSISVGRIFMGGAGGGGQQNNSVATAGGEGGGIILLKANELRTGATCASAISITANGETVPASGNDGGGGGGAGGSIVIQVDAWNISAACPIAINANGGNGSSINSSTHGGGGGGGQGAIFYSIARPSTNTTTTTNIGTGGCNNSSSPCNSQAANGGGANNSGIFDNAVSPLPVTLIYWNASLKNQSVVLDWATINEEVKFYEVEKSVGNIADFVKIAQVLPKNQVNITNYQVVDKNFNENKGKTTYYRLKIMENNGIFNYSKVISVSNNNLVINDLQIYPNPFENEFYIKGIAANAEIEKIVVSDMYGRIILEIIKPIENMPISLQSYPKGTYLVAIQTVKEVFYKKISKIN